MRRNGRDQPLRHVDIHLQRTQVSIIDPDQRRTRVERDGQLLRVVDLHQRIEPDFLGANDHRLKVTAVEGAGDEEHRIGAGGAGLEQLILGHDEVFTE